MVKYFLQQLVALCFAALLFSCSSTNSKPLLIEFSADSSAIMFSHIDQAGLQHLQQYGANDTVVKNLVSILEIPTAEDTTFIERPVEGKFSITDRTLVFVPQSSFIKDRDYLVTTHLNARFGDVKMLLKGDLKTGVQPVVKLLHR